MMVPVYDVLYFVTLWSVVLCALCERLCVKIMSYRYPLRQLYTHFLRLDDKIDDTRSATTTLVQLTATTTGTSQRYELQTNVDKDPILKWIISQANWSNNLLTGMKILRKMVNFRHLFVGGCIVLFTSISLFDASTTIVHAFVTTTPSCNRPTASIPQRYYQKYDATNMYRQHVLVTARYQRSSQRNAVPAAVTAAAATASSSTILSSLLSPLGSILILAIIILVHESGHYMAAKQFGITVEEFSIGFGPKLLSSTLGPDKDEFNVRLIPLGGYVRFPENYNTTLAREIQQYEMNQAEDFIRQRKPNLAEQIINALTLGIIEDQKWQSEKQRRIQEIRNQKQQRQVLEVVLPWWKRLTQISKSKLSSSSSPSTTGTTIDLATEIEYFDDPTLLQNRPWIERAIVLSGGVIFNLILAFVLYFGQINFGAGLPVPIFDNGIVISANPRPDAAANGLLRQGDIIVKVNGVDVMSNVQSTSSSSPSAISSQQAISEFIARIRATNEGDTLALSVVHPIPSRASAPFEENVPNLSPKMEEILVRPKRSNNGSGPMTIGVLLSPNYKQTNIVRTSNPIEAANYAVQYVSTLTQETANGILALIRTLVIGFIGGSTSSNGMAANSVAGQVSGPLGLLRTGSQVVSSQDITSIVLFTAAISINLAVINSLPFPALDGGQLVFVLSEAITGRKVNQRFQENLTAVAVLFLLFVSLSTFVGDLNTVFGK